MKQTSRSLQDPYGLELLKFICVLFMVFIHSTFYLIYEGRGLHQENFLYDISRHFTYIGFFPMVIPALAGLILRLRWSSSIQQQRLTSEGLKKSLPLILFVFLVGFIVNPLAHFSAPGFSWYMHGTLEFISISFLLVGLVALLNIHLIPVAGLIVLALTPWLRNIAIEPELLRYVLVSDGGHHFFWPLFPWFFTVCFGFYFAHLLERFFKKPWFSPVASVLSLCTLAAVFFFFTPEYAVNPKATWGTDIFQPSLSTLLAMMAFLVVLLLASTQLSRYIPKHPHGIISSYSRGILWIYVTHTIIGYNLSVPLRNWWKSGFIPTPWTDEYFQPRLVVAFCLYLPFMLLFSWGVGYLAIRWLHEKSYRIQLKKA